MPLQVSWGEEVPVRAFRQTADAVEARVNTSWAVRSVCRDPSRRCLTAYWHKAVKYNAAYAFFKAALSDQPLEDAKWTLVVSTAVPAVSVQSSARGAASSHVSTEPAEADVLANLENDLTTPPKSSPFQTSHHTEGAAPGVFPQAQPLKGWLVVKALELFRTTETCSKAFLADAVTTGDEVLGEGTFGVVRKGVQESSGVVVALKTLKDNKDYQEFLHEVTILSRLSHPNVVSLVDVIVRPRLSLVLAYAGSTLVSALTSGAFTLSVWRDAFKQLLEGLRYLHSQFVVHADLKPSNICWEDGRLTILDFGNSVLCLPGFRSCRPASGIQQGGLRYVTLPFRAIEIVLGDPAWESASDCWSAGVILARMFGVSPLFDAESSTGMAIAIFSKLGSPTAEDMPYFERLPLFSSQFPRRDPCSVAEIFGQAISSDCMDIFSGFMKLAPARRMTANAALDCMRQFADGRNAVPLANTLASGIGSVASRALQDEVEVPMTLISLNGKQTFDGGRGPCNIREAWLQPALLKWLTECLGAADGDWSWDVTPKQTDRWVEFGQKLEVCGHLGPQVGKRHGLTLNGKNASVPLMSRVRAFALAFKKVNRLSLEALDEALKTSIKLLKKDKVHVGANGTAFLQSSASDWACDLGAVQLMRANVRQDPVHFDGGASFLHMGVTLFGERSLRLRHVVDGDLVEANINMSPGHVYFGCLCGPEHYVQHRPSELLFQSAKLGPVEVVFLLRGRCFRDARASTQAAGPVPALLWKALAQSVVSSLEQLPWVLPSVSVCRGEEAKLHG